jgi:hypothetical protein
MPPRDVSYFEGVGGGFGFPSSFQTVLIKFLLFPSITHQNLLFSSSSKTSHQIPLVPVITHQNPFVFIYFPLFPSSSCNFLLFSTQHYINPHKALNFGINSFFLQLGNLALETVPW